MARQIMKALAMTIAIGSLAAASALVANGQRRKAIRADVPFDFIVVERSLRAGNYEIGIPNTTGAALALRDSEGISRVMRQSHQAERSGDNLAAKLVFHRYGSTYFLAQAWTAGERTGCELPKSRQERALENELKKLAAYRGKSASMYEVVEVYATER